MERDFVEKLKELLDLSRNVELELEQNGLKSTTPEIGIIKEQLFRTTIPSLVGACQAIARGEPMERAEIRLKRDFPAAYSGLDKIRQTPAGKKIVAHLDKLKVLVDYISKEYPRL
jgi:hypothetical protein